MASARRCHWSRQHCWSGDGENYDEDYYVKIYLLSPKQLNEAAAKQAAAKKKAHSSAAPPSWSRHLVASGPFGELATATKPSYDAGYFCRNPCHVPGGLAEIDPSLSFATFGPQLPEAARARTARLGGYHPGSRAGQGALLRFLQVR